MKLSAATGEGGAAKRHLLFALCGAVTLLALTGAVLPAAPQEAQFTPREENPEDYPAGPGREETFYRCTACHAFRLVAQQGMSRERWDETLNWMTERQGMPPLEGKERETVLNYLSTTFPPRKAPSGWQNPFLNQ